MDLRILKNFIAIAQEENITKAAEALNMTQPNLSRQIKELEEKLSATLLIRGKKKTVLTEDGMLLYHYASELIELEEKCKNEFINRNNLLQGKICIGLSECRGANRIADCMQSFSQQFPQITYEIYNGNAYDIMEKINNGLLDVGVLIQPIDVSRYDSLDIGVKEQWGVVVNHKHPLANQTTITFNDIQSEDLIIPKRAYDQHALYDWFGKDPNSLSIKAMYTIFSNAIYLVEHNMGCAICNNGALGIRNNATTVFIPLMPELAYSSVLIWKRTSHASNSVSLFIKHTYKTIKTHKAIQ